MLKNKTIFGGILIVCILALAGTAYADSGYDGHMMGYGGYTMGPGYNMMEPGYDGGHMMNWGANYRPYTHSSSYDGYAYLSPDQKAALDHLQNKFDNETQGVLRKIDARQFALHTELMKNNPNKDRALELQKEISKLQTKFNQQAIKHELAIHKILPENDLGQRYGAWYGGGNEYAYCW